MMTNIRRWCPTFTS